jgi:hypothetical protein
MDLLVEVVAVVVVLVREVEVDGGPVLRGAGSVLPLLRCCRSRPAILPAICLLLQVTGKKIQH